MHSMMIQKSGMPQRLCIGLYTQVRKISGWHDITLTQSDRFHTWRTPWMRIGRIGSAKIFGRQWTHLVVTSDKDGEGCQADKELVDADVVISQPFFSLLSNSRTNGICS